MRMAPVGVGRGEEYRLGVGGCSAERSKEHLVTVNTQTGAKPQCDGERSRLCIPRLAPPPPVTPWLFFRLRG